MRKMWSYENGFGEASQANLDETERDYIAEQARMLIKADGVPRDEVAYCFGVLSAIELKIIEEAEMKMAEEIQEVNV